MYWDNVLDIRNGRWEYSRLPWNSDVLKNGIFETFTGLKMWYILCWIGHFRAAGRINTCSALAVFYRKSSETDKAYLVAFTECILDTIKYGINGDTGLLLGDFCIFGNVRYEIFFSHLFTPSLLLLLKAIRLLNHCQPLKIFIIFLNMKLYR